jgi:hypothetical protein
VAHDADSCAALGFGAPVISALVQPLNGPFPNVMALPYGKCPPLHIQTPSWQQLLRLLARAGGSRIEPTVEALALGRPSLKLRTVIQVRAADFHCLTSLTRSPSLSRSVYG